MTISETIFQCDECKRYFNADLSLRPERFMALVPESFVCAEPDCAAVRAELAAADLLAATRRQQRKIDRRHGLKRPGGRPAAEQRGRLPYADVEREPANMVSVPNLMSPGARQEAFVASGVTSQTDARVRDFLLAPHNFGNWFSRNFLKQIARNDLLNNIADRLRDELMPQGLYIDNCNLREAADSPRTSHYRACRIADAISLTAVEKASMPCQQH